jgi:hypothetical protein
VIRRRPRTQSRGRCDVSAFPSTGSSLMPELFRLACALPCGSVETDLAVRHQMAQAAETATRAVGRDPAACEFGLAGEAQELTHPRDVTEPQVRELQVNLPGSGEAQAGEGPA